MSDASGLIAGAGQFGAIMPLALLPRQKTVASVKEQADGKLQRLGQCIGHRQEMLPYSAMAMVRGVCNMEQTAMVMPKLRFERWALQQ